MRSKPHSGSGVSRFSPATTIGVLTFIIMAGLLLAIVFGSDRHSSDDARKVIAIAEKSRSAAAAAAAGEEGKENGDAPVPPRSAFDHARQRFAAKLQQQGQHGEPVKRQSAREKWQAQVRFRSKDFAAADTTLSPELIRGAEWIKTAAVQHDDRHHRHDDDDDEKGDGEEHLGRRLRPGAAAAEDDEHHSHQLRKKRRHEEDGDNDAHHHDNNVQLPPPLDSSKIKKRLHDTADHVGDLEGFDGTLKKKNKKKRNEQQHEMMLLGERSHGGGGGGSGQHKQPLRAGGHNPDVGEEDRQREQEAEQQRHRHPDDDGHNKKIVMKGFDEQQEDGHDDPYLVREPPNRDADLSPRDRLKIRGERRAADSAFDAEELAQRRRNALRAAIPVASQRPPRGTVFKLDKPRQQDEEDFFHWPKSQGGKLELPNTTSNVVDWEENTTVAALALYAMFKKFDENENAENSIPVFTVPCVGVDCGLIASSMIPNLKVPLGHFVVVLNDNTPRFVRQFTVLMEAFPGRFTMFHRPHKLSCAESWNLATRIGFSIRPMVPFVFISNADWHPRPTIPDRIKFQFQRFARWNRDNLHLVLNRFFHFSSFSFNKKGFLELGYFDEVIYPALTEDVEFHLKAVSKGMGELGLYDNWQKGSVHLHRASSKDAIVSGRHHRVARFNYILQKWGVSIPSGPKDFALARPHKFPFGIPYLKHNSSWVVDPAHRKCANTGNGTKFSNSPRCWYNVEVLRELLPAEVRETYEFNKRLLTLRDMFPGPYH